MFQKKSTAFPTTRFAMVVAVVVTVVTTGFDARAEDAAATTASVQKWEYRALRIPDGRPSGGRKPELNARRSGSQETLNQLGEEGWELVAVRNDTDGEPVFYLKRPK